MPTPRAILTALIPGLLSFLIFWLWLATSLPFAIAAGLLWTAGSLLVTRFVYDDAEGELAAWRAEAPDLAGPISTPASPRAETSPPAGTPRSEETPR